MPSSTFAVRAGGILAVAALASSLAACAAEPELGFTSPTMAPEQSLIEACAISGDEVDRLTADAQQQISSEMELAASELASGNLPSLDALSGTLDDTLAEIEGQLSNSEVLAAVGNVRTAMQGFADIQQPESALGLPAYLASLGSQLSDLAQAGKQLQALCNAG